MRVKYSLIQKILSLCTLMVFFFAITPHEFIHDEIVHHKDTVDGRHSHAGVSHHHIHCKFLQEVIAPYIAGHAEAPPYIQVSYYTFTESIFPFHPIKTLFHSSLRGPPPENIEMS